MTSVADFGTVLAQHPLVAPGWAQKLCYYVNSAPCDERDPEFVRIVDLFRARGRSWRTLVKALVTSPLTTYAARDARPRRAGGEVVAVSRRDHFCAALDARLGFDDACGLDALGRRPSRVDDAPRSCRGCPRTRTAAAPSRPSFPTSRRSSSSRASRTFAKASPRWSSTLPAGPKVKRWSSADPDGAIRDFVSMVMALAPPTPRGGPGDPRADGAFRLGAREPGITATEALRSTFVVACLAPSAVSVGL